MNKRTYNSLTKMLKEARKEAWNKYYDEVKKQKPAEAAKYYEAYSRTAYLHIDLEVLIDKGE